MAGARLGAFVAAGHVVLIAVVSVHLGSEHFLALASTLLLAGKLGSHLDESLLLDALSFLHELTVELLLIGLVLNDDTRIRVVVHGQTCAQMQMFGVNTLVRLSLSTILDLFDLFGLHPKIKEFGLILAEEQVLHALSLESDSVGAGLFIVLDASRSNNRDLLVDVGSGADAGSVQTDLLGLDDVTAHFDGAVLSLA